MSLMTINGLVAELNLPAAPKDHGNETIHVLPPYDRREAFLVDEYPACPTNWMHGSNKAASYFAAIEPQRHLWLDFTSNMYHKHNVAIVVSVQGINPITGQQTKALRLEQYREKCPVHDLAFGVDRFCEKCNYKWPGQNYLSSVTNQPLWIDGWRAKDGEIRGFLVTSEMIKGVASQIIGEDRVFAIGIAFYLSKVEKPQPLYQPISTTQHQMNNIYKQMWAKKGMKGMLGGPGGSSVGSGPGVWNTYDDGHKVSMAAPPSSMSANMVQGQTTPDCAALDAGYSEDDGGAVSLQSLTAESPRQHTNSNDSLRRVMRTKSVKQVEVEKLEIAAGAKIMQDFGFDPNELSFYKDEPEGMLYLNYCTTKDLKKILEAGKKDFTNGGEGFLAELTKGNKS